MTPQVVFIILNWNGREFLGKCLASVLAQDYGDYKVLVVDNGSVDGSAEMVRADFPGAQLLELGRNLGYPRGNNEGIRYALEHYAADYVLLLNNDTELTDKAWLSGMIGEAQTDPAAGVLGCRLVSEDGATQSLGRRITPCGFPGIKDPPEGALAAPYYVDAVIGAVFLIRRGLLDRIGLLDEGFSPFAGEDIDYCARAARAGYRIKVVPRLRVTHYTSRTIKRLPSRYSRVAAKKGELRFKLLNLGFAQLAEAALCEAAELAACVLERRDKTAGFSPCNMRLRAGWGENLVCQLSAYVRVFAGLAGVIRGRARRNRAL